MKFFLSFLILLLVACSQKDKQVAASTAETSPKSTSEAEVSHYLQVYDFSHLRHSSIRNFFHSMLVGGDREDHWVKSSPLATEEAISFVNEHPIKAKLNHDKLAPEGVIYDLTEFFTSSFKSDPGSLILFDSETSQLYLIGSKESHEHFVAFSHLASLDRNHWRQLSIAVNYLEAPHSKANIEATTLDELDSATLLHETKISTTGRNDGSKIFSVQSEKLTIEADIEHAISATSDHVYCNGELEIETPEHDCHLHFSTLNSENYKVIHLGTTKDMKKLRMLNVHCHLHQPYSKKIALHTTAFPSQPYPHAPAAVVKQTLRCSWPVEIDPEKHQHLSKLDATQIKREGDIIEITATPAELREIYPELQAGAGTPLANLSIKLYKIPRSKIARAVKNLSTRIQIPADQPTWKTFSSNIVNGKLLHDSLKNDGVQLQIGEIYIAPVEPYIHFKNTLNIKDEGISTTLNNSYLLNMNTPRVDIIAQSKDHYYASKFIARKLPIKVTISPAKSQ